MQNLREFLTVIFGLFIFALTGLALLPIIDFFIAMAFVLVITSVMMYIFYGWFDYCFHAGGEKR